MPETVDIKIGDKIYKVDLDNEFSVSEETLIQDMCTQASKFAFWNTLYAMSRKHLMTLENIAYARYEAHIKEVAKYYLIGKGEKKPTLEAINNTAIKLWSRTSPLFNGENATHPLADYVVQIAKTVSLGKYGEEANVGDEQDWIFQEEFIISWQEWQDRIVEAKYAVDVLFGVVEAFRHKRDMLQSIGAMIRMERESI